MCKVKDIYNGLHLGSFSYIKWKIFLSKKNVGKYKNNPVRPKSYLSSKKKDQQKFCEISSKSYHILLVFYRSVARMSLNECGWLGVWDQNVVKMSHSTGRMGQQEF